MMSWVYNWTKRSWYDALVVWLDGYILRSGSDIWLHIRDLQLYWAISLKYVKKVSSIRYGIKNYDDKAKCKAKNKSCRRIKTQLIMDLEIYNV